MLKFENFAVIRRMSDFSASLGIPLGAQAAGHSLSATSQGITEGTAGSGRAARPGLVLQAPSMGARHRGWRGPEHSRESMPGKGSRWIQETRNPQKGFPVDPVFCSEFVLALRDILKKEKEMKIPNLYDYRYYLETI